jgi:hypothetical protein
LPSRGLLAIVSSTKSMFTSNQAQLVGINRKVLFQFGSTFILRWPARELS